MSESELIICLLHFITFSDIRFVIDLLYFLEMGGHSTLRECHRSSILGKLVQEAAPYLYPCVIEYSLICAAVTYVMWKNCGKSPEHFMKNEAVDRRNSRYMYTMDCSGAHKGLFTGLLVLIVTFISLILFFVLINTEKYHEAALFEAQISELILYVCSSVAAVIGFLQMKNLKFNGGSKLELDHLLLVVAQSGLYMYSMFVMIGGYFYLDEHNVLTLITGFAMLLQGAIQTMFILHTSKKVCYTHDQIKRKPGREVITFLIVTNLSMWAINTFETSRSAAHPMHTELYGLMAWTVLSHIAMPLAIFYRFHSTVCLCEIWTDAYKAQPYFR